MVDWLDSSRQLSNVQSPNTNPYLKSGPTRTQTSVVAVLDLLGFMGSTEVAYKMGTAQDLLVRLRAALTIASEAFNDELPGFEGETRSWQIKSYTDNLVIGSPIVFPDAEDELGSVILGLRHFQLTMANRGFFLRGGLAVGELYLDDDIAFGNGLLEAYKVESELARDPRIALSESLSPYLEKHLKFYAEPIESPHNQVLLRDADDQLFVNYLGAAFDETPGNPDFSLISAHQSAVTTKLTEFKTSPPVWGKYAWVANYHNFVCEEQGNGFLQYLIDPTALRLTPSRIVK